MKPKVFCVGFHKTGTTSLHAALEHLGYRVCGVQLDLAESLLKGDLSAALRRTHEYDAFRDNPWPLLFQELDRAHPGSKFVLTTRAPARWIASVVRHFGLSDTQMRRWIYGSPHPLGHEETYLSRYRRHNVAVRRYFEGRSDALVELRLEEGHGWSELCKHLDHPVPACSFPHRNRGAVVADASENE